jgi:AraC family transcriptional regulator
MSSQVIVPSSTPGLLPVMPLTQKRQNRFRVLLLSDEPGVLEVPGMRNTIVSIHVGSSVQIACRRGGLSYSGTAVHGDIDIIPSETPSLWDIKEKDTALILSLAPELLTSVAEEFDVAPEQVEIRNRFQVRDPQLENIAWALKAEMESGYPCGSLYLDSLAISVAARLVRSHSSLSVEPKRANGRLLDRRLRQVFSYIEDNLNRDIALSDLAAVAGLSLSHFKSLFRQSVGLPAHQYVIRRRVERAKNLLCEGKLSISQIAFESGFAHQSHLAHHMRRVLGLSPKALRKMLG